MLDSLQASMSVASSGLEAQSTRMRIVSENLANATATGRAAGADPYQRKTINFAAVTDEAEGVDMVQVDDITRDQAPFRTEYMPGHPAADAKGYVKMPNVDSLVEIMDMREAQRSYEADLTVMDASKTMLARTVDLLRR